MWQRIYAELLMPPRLDQYGDLIAAAAAHGYQMHSLRSFWQIVERGAVDAHARYLISRHDVDADVGAAGLMWKAEQSLGAHASYYFRLGTVDVSLMRAIEQSGSEASYHYEELATLVKKRRIKDREHVYAAMPEIRRRFKENLCSLRERTGLPMVTVASHGDFANRKLNIPNWEILRSQALRWELGIGLEAYDEAIMRYVTSRHCDCAHRRLWLGENPIAAIRRGEPVIYLLTHPGHWRSNPRECLPHDLRRLWEGICYALPARAWSA